MCKHFLSEHFAENGITLWCTVAKLWCLSLVQFFLEHPVVSHSNLLLNTTCLVYSQTECGFRLHNDVVIAYVHKKSDMEPVYHSCTKHCMVQCADMFGALKPCFIASWLYTLTCNELVPGTVIECLNGWSEALTVGSPF